MTRPIGDPALTKKRLIRILQKAHAAERGAALAYRGHAASVRDPRERAAIYNIEMEEWRHREMLQSMLTMLGAPTLPVHEIVMFMIGRSLSSLCFLCGRFLPMFCAYWLERVNVHQYASAARHARAAGFPSMAQTLLMMEEVEAEHVHTFASFMGAGRREVVATRESN